jgi:membrane carboxypeptidase/penicillin-binding protein
MLLVLIAVTAVGATGFVAMSSIATLSQDLPDPEALSTLSFDEPTLVYDRTGKVQLGRFERAARHVVDSARSSARARRDDDGRGPDVLGNDGYDVQAMSRPRSRRSRRRARRLDDHPAARPGAAVPADVVDPGADLFVRKAKEIIQSARLTQAFPGQTGKQQIITAYLNQVFYGHDAYGIAAAAQIYFGISKLSDLTPAQAALLAALPKSPSSLDPYRYAVTNKKGQLVVPQDAPPMIRRDWVLDNLVDSRWTHLTPQQLAAAKTEPVILRGDQPLIYKAPHFMWQVRGELEQILGSADAVETGGYRVITTLDWHAQQIAQHQLRCGRGAQPAARSATRLLDPWHPSRTAAGSTGCGARTSTTGARGDRLPHRRRAAYVGSAGYYLDGLRAGGSSQVRRGRGRVRQPGSAFKPVLYSTASSGRSDARLAAARHHHHFNRAENWAPKDADGLERGRCSSVKRCRCRSTSRRSARSARRQRGGRRPGGEDGPGVPGASRRSWRPGSPAPRDGRGPAARPRVRLRHDRQRRRPRAGPDDPRSRTGRARSWQAPEAGKRAMSAAAAYQVTDILKGNTNPSVNPIWAAKLAIRNGPDGTRRPAAVKTGTATDARDLSTYGYLAPPANPKGPALAIGVWLGNSDHSMPRS